MDFEEFARLPDEEQELLTGALLVARDAHPSLDLALQQGRVDDLARGLSAASKLDARDQAEALAEHLYIRLGFSGNEADYYDPRNSFLDDVLERRTGIPISLAVVYIEVARRAGIPAYGIGFPGHFLVGLGHHGPPTVVDPFHSGEVLDPRAVENLWKRATERPGPVPAEALEPASVRDVVVRMLLNLRSIYASRAEHSSLLLVLDRIVTLKPGSLRELRDRGLLQARLGAPRAAAVDLERYVLMAPDADDTERVRQIIAQLVRSEPELN